MSSKKAICQCKGNSEDNLVVPIKTSRIGFSEKWSVSDWIWFIILVLFTGGGWIAVVVGWNAAWMFDPPYLCQFCNEKIESSQFR